MTEYSVVGKRMPRVDALDKVTGRALYSADIILPQMLHGKVLRSSHPHAIIRLLDISKAQALEGVMAVITAADVPGYQDGGELIAPGIPHLARQKVVFHQQPVAAVAAINPYIAEEALSLIEVEYEELTPVFDVLEAGASVPPSNPGIKPRMLFPLRGSTLGNYLSCMSLTPRPTPPI
ncbi:hypothetical protein ACFLV0_06740 [Chloroflexota bacterium]